MPAKRGSMIFRMTVAIVLYVVTIRLKLEYRISLALMVFAYLIVGINVIKKSFMDILRGEFFDENFLMLVATLGAFVTEQYIEAISVMIIYEIGEMLQDKAVDDSKEAIIGLIDKRPKYVNVVVDDNVIKVRPENVKVGDVVVLGAGESVSLDGVIVKGAGNIDFSSLTGESVPKYLKEGDVLYSGGILKDATLHMKVTKSYKESTLSKMLEFIENANIKKSKTERFMTRFSKIYTPVVITMAVLFVVLARWIELSQRIKRACMFLVIACPCALVLSLPLCFFYGIGLCSKKGVLVKGSMYIEAMSNLGEVMFDKTGTLTKGEFGVVQVNDVGKEDTLELAAYCEASSRHPIASAIRDAYGKDINYDVISDAKEIAGRGTSCKIRGKEVLVGNKKLMEENNIIVSEVVGEVACAYVACDGECVGSIVVSDSVRDGSSELVAKFMMDGIGVSMITGDSNAVARSVANELGIEQVYGEVFPEDKANIVKNRVEANKASVAFVGDGINDVLPILAADVGISMGGIGSDAAIEASDVVVMDDCIERIGQLVDIAKTTMRTAKVNIIMVLLVKSVVLVLCALGKSTMWGAIVADVGVSIVAILHSTRELTV